MSDSLEDAVCRADWMALTLTLAVVALLFCSSAERNALLSLLAT
ncbi:MAG: hypothetical protein SXV54_03220 [Chloroflexota bacterium]|nr:hypothetical protein [Chloroflexota bacterium]